MNKFSDVYIILFLLLFSCSEEQSGERFTPPNPPDKKEVLFERIPPEVSGVDFNNRLTETDSMNILDYLYFYNGGGVAIGDINNDGLQDLFFTANQEPNRLFLNQGDFQFTDITETAGIAGNSDWNTGVTMADVNADGYLDIYVLAVSGINGLQGKNELFINNGDGTFNEKASQYGIALSNYGTAASFFDFDNDGDLDLYVLNHAVHTEDSFGPAKVRERRTESSGDKLFENIGSRFLDVSEKAGIYGGPNSYGLGLATADFNNDGFTDIYVSNDFHEDDYLYLNNGDGTFSEKMKEKMVQVSRFSMGSDVADINHDGYPDLLSLDMLPEDEVALKRSVGDEDIKILDLRMKYGYHRQFSRNMLQLNNAGNNFQEIGLFCGIEATDWSWSALFADYDLDGEQDLFVSNGISKRPNDLDYIKYISNNQIIQNDQESEFIDRKALKIMPEGKVHNYFFKGDKDLKFRDLSEVWVNAKKSVSNGSAYGDLDNDGDLDLVTNNLNSPATLYRNSSSAKGHFLKLRFQLEGQNKRGIGTKVYSYLDGNLQYAQLFSGKGFQSSSEDALYFGYGNSPIVDSLVIIWPDGTSDKRYQVATNQALKLSPSGSATSKVISEKNKPKQFERAKIRGLEYVHQENNFNDFDHQKLIPYKISSEGPAVAVGDLNEDGKEDLFIGNSRGTRAEVRLQSDDGFVKSDFPFLGNTRALEITDVSIEDFNGDGRNDIFFVTGGGEFSEELDVLKDQLWLQSDTGWKRMQLPEYYSEASVIKPGDFDGDGDLDVFIGGRAVAGDFGKIPESFLLKNERGQFRLEVNKELTKAGMITDAIWEDLDADGFPELLLAGEWMSPKIFKNNKGSLELLNFGKIEELKGLWRSIAAFDIDADGDKDLLLGNWGINSKFLASQDYPLRMYYGDIDGNGTTETILAQEKNGEYYSLAGLDELVSQMNFLRKKFTNYQGFAGKNMEDVFGGGNLARMKIREVNVLESGYLRNDAGKFTFIPFNKNLQFAPINAILVNKLSPSFQRAVFGGNFFGVIPYHGAFGAFSGTVIYPGQNVETGPEQGLDFTGKAVNDLKVIRVDKEEYLLVFINNDAADIYKIKPRQNETNIDQTISAVPVH